MALFLFLILILVANVAIGYVIAVLFGLGPSDLRVAMASVLRSKTVGQFKNVFFGLFGRFVRLLRPIVEPLNRLMGKGDASESSQARETTEEKLQKISEKAVGEFLDDESSEIMRVSPIPELFDDHLMNLIFEHGTEVWMASDKHIETSIQKLNLIMMESGQFAGELDEKLRSIQGHAALDDARRACKNLGDDCRNYLENQSMITEEIHSRVEEFGELRRLADEIDRGNQEQVSQIETTLGNLDRLSKSENANEMVDRMIQELANLRKARHNMRDIQDQVFLSIAHYENRMESINRHETFIDPVTGLNNRIAFQTNLWDWWRQDRQKKTKLTFALYDIVGFTERNNRIGIRKCDRLLQALARLVEERVENMDFIGMYAGNRLVSVSSNGSLRKTIAFVERIRQEIEHIQFTFADGTDDVSIRLTCAVTEALETQSEGELIAALDETLDAAKKAGRNLTFVYEPAKPTAAPEPVVAPELTVSDRIFDVKNMRLLDAVVV